MQKTPVRPSPSVRTTSKFFQQNRWRFRLVLASFISLLAFGMGYWMYKENPDTLSGYLQNIIATVVGTVFTITVLDTRANQRNEQALIDQMGSPSNDFALEAVRILRNSKVLTDGSLKAINLEKANLMNSNLHRANLRTSNLRMANLNGTDLIEANLRSAELIEANLQGADLQFANLWMANLSGANLSNAYLVRADLPDADLSGANLTGANLDAADLRGANLRRANLSGSTLSGAYFDQDTKLPDNSMWSKGRDMTEFTDPEAWAKK